MVNSDKLSPEIETGHLSPIKANLADLLTLSRILIGLAILCLSLVGKNAYLAVVILVLVGAATDILDGKVARHYLGPDKEGKLGKYEMEIDTFFILCALGYLSFSGIIIPRLLGLGWITLAVVASVVYKKRAKILIVVETISVIALLIVAAIYNFKIFGLIITPAFLAGLIINRKRVFYLLFKHYPRIFST